MIPRSPSVTPDASPRDFDDQLHDNRPRRGRSLKRKSSLQGHDPYSKPKIIKLDHRLCTRCIHQQKMQSPLPMYFPAPVQNPPRLDSPESRSRSRSRSPVRRVVTQLEQALPSIRVLQYTAVRSEIPSVLSSLKSQLVQKARDGYFPQSLKDTIHAEEQNQWEEMGEHEFGPVELGATSAGAVWAKVRKIHNRARACHDFQKDENAWTGVIRSVFKLATRLRSRGGPVHEFELNEIQSQNIQSIYLPTVFEQDRASQVNKRADLALAFPLDDPRIMSASQLARVSGSHDVIALSHMADTYTSRTPLVCAVEVKRSGGNTKEAELQLSVWQAAALKHLRFGVPTRDLSQVCLIGWTIVGHQWNLYLSWSSVDGSTTTCGPLEIPLSTISHRSIFRLLAVLRHVQSWLDATYWPAFSDLLTQATVT